MTRSRLAPIALACLLAPPAAAEEVDHPAYLSWSRHPVGTAIVMRSRSTSPARTLTTTTTTTLHELKPDEAVLRVVRESDATEGLIRSPVETRRLFRRFPLFGAAKKEDVGRPVGAIDRGEETIAVAGREYRAVWFDTKGKGDGGLEWTTRTWMSDEVPDRLLKSVTRFPAADTTVTVEMIDLRPPAPTTP